MPSVWDEEHEYFYIFETQIDNLKTSMNVSFTRYFSDKDEFELKFDSCFAFAQIMFSPKRSNWKILEVL